MAIVKQLNWTKDMEFLLLGTVHGHKAHIHGGDSVWNTISKELDQHPLFHKNSDLCIPLSGTAKASAKYTRLLKNFRRVYGEDTANLSRLRDKFTREEELLFLIHSDKALHDQAKSMDKRTSAELQDKFRRQDLTHGLEAGHKHHDEENPDEFDGEDELISENGENPRPKKRNRSKRSGTVQESVEFTEHKARMQERALIRDEERRLRQEREMKALEETTAYNRRAEERQIRSLEVATATLNVTQKLVENSGIQSAALAKLLEKSS